MNKGYDYNRDTCITRFCEYDKDGKCLGRKCNKRTEREPVVNPINHKEEIMINGKLYRLVE